MAVGALHVVPNGQIRSCLEARCRCTAIVRSSAIPSLSASRNAPVIEADLMTRMALTVIASFIDHTEARERVKQAGQELTKKATARLRTTRRMAEEKIEWEIFHTSQSAMLMCGRSRVPPFVRAEGPWPPEIIEARLAVESGPHVHGLTRKAIAVTYIGEHERTQRTLSSWLCSRDRESPKNNPGKRLPA